MGRSIFSMQLPDIWQVIGTPQVAEITAVVSTFVSVFLAQRSSQETLHF
jgi:hypothetical protein